MGDLDGLRPIDIEGTDFPGIEIAGVGANIPEEQTYTYTTNMWDVLNAVKKNLMDYSRSSNSSTLHKVRSWCIGFVFSNMVFPVISVFPVSKTFVPTYSGGLCTVEYKVSIDIYSERSDNIETAKEFCMKAINEIKMGIKKYLQMPDRTGFRNGFSTTIEEETLFEDISKEANSFYSKASVIIVIKAYHQFNEDKVGCTTIYDTDYNDFVDKVEYYVRSSLTADLHKVRSWNKKVYNNLSVTPAVVILPGNEQILETLTNRYARVTRPINFNVLSKGFPSKALIKSNILLADEVVKAIEENYLIGGYAQECALNAIDYLSLPDAGFNFISTISVDYVSRRKFDIKYIGDSYED